MGGVAEEDEEEEVRFRIIRLGSGHRRCLTLPLQLPLVLLLRCSPLRCSQPERWEGKGAQNGRAFSHQTTDAAQTNRT